MVNYQVSNQMSIGASKRIGVHFQQMNAYILINLSHSFHLSYLDK